MTDHVLRWTQTEQLRAGFSEYKGRRYFGVRVWYSKDGQMFPSKQGINIPADRSAEVVAFIVKAHDQAAEQKGGIT